MNFGDTCQRIVSREGHAVRARSIHLNSIVTSASYSGQTMSRIGESLGTGKAI